MVAKRTRAGKARASQEWADYLFMRRNPGIVLGAGCMRMAAAAGSTQPATASPEILSIYPMGQEPPELPERKYL